MVVGNNSAVYMYTIPNAAETLSFPIKVENTLNKYILDITRNSVIIRNSIIETLLWVSQMLTLLLKLS